MNRQRETFEHKGRTFAVEFHADEDISAPWKEFDGHGVIHQAYESEKKPGWKKLAPTGSRDVWYWYDVQASMKLARKDGWDAEPYTGTKGERAARAVAADFAFLEGFCNGSWAYVGAVVTLLDKHGEPTEYTDSLWGIETYKSYHLEAVKEMADGILSQVHSDRAAKAKETRERNFWAARDVLTA